MSNEDEISATMEERDFERNSESCARCGHARCAHEPVCFCDDHKFVAPRRTILIAEDNPLLMRAYERTLSKHFKVIMAHSTSLAIGVLVHDFMLGEPTIEAVVSDYDLGDGTGADVYRWIKDNRPDLPFFLCTGNQGVKLDAVTFHKPFGIQDLRKTIEAAL